ncbi:MAG TPA: translation initiation factor IF-2 [Acidimicrobiia bacterium]|nr:translation initiation factor IF-2 [Acidimicrobiia bacterium]
MAQKKIRVYELARELGVDNSVVIDLSAELKIGVKSHSSSIDDPSADRVRRLADSKGLRREPIVEEAPAPKKAAPKKVVSSSSRAKKPAEAPATPAEIDLGVAEDVEQIAPVKSKVIRSSAAVAVGNEGVTKERISEQLKEEAEIAKAVARVSGPAAGGAAQQNRRGPVPPPPPGRRIQSPPPGALGVRRGPGGTGTGDSTGRGGAGPRGTGAGQTTFPTPNTQNFPPSGVPGKGRGAPRGGPGGRGPGGGRKKKGKKRRGESDLQPAQTTTLTPKDTAVPEGEIIITQGTTVQDFAPKLNRTTADIVKMMFEAGEMLTATQSLADEMIELIAEELGATVLIVEAGQEAELELLSLLQDDDEVNEDALIERPPIVTVMGHVDHGKTTLLDAIRKTNVVGGESGGITQHIGAYQTQHNGKALTFIDTPGHEAFSQMRARGAKATDVAVLVVAANDGVMPQTLEALSHAKAAEVPIIVAVTKVDREDADPQRVRQMMTEHELVPEEWGGTTMFVDVSPKTGQGMDDLLEAIVLVAETEELTADPTSIARARVLEAHLDPGRGPVATVIVETGTLRVGDMVVAGQGWGKVRAMFTDDGANVDEAGPSVPVAVLGLSSAPLAGDQLRVAPNDRAARTIADARERRRRLANSLQHLSVSGGARLEDIFTAVARGEVATLSLVLKADVQGSLEALTDSLKKLDKDHEEVRLSFVHRAVGGITESDVSLAAVSNATIIGFNVRPDRNAREAAEKAGVDMRLYEVIYKVLDDMNAALQGMLSPTFEEVVTGEAEVREIFSVPKLGKIAGCYVQTGVIARGSKVRFLREGVVIWKGNIISLRREKDDVKEVRDGFECGIGLENFTDLKPGDIIETYDEKEVARG